MNDDKKIPTPPYDELPPFAKQHPLVKRLRPKLEPAPGVKVLDRPPKQ